ncbi:MAG: hypothetical protein ACPGRZ_05800 [Alphaproteobacteria bacterium]
MMNRIGHICALLLCVAALPALAASPSAKYDTLKAGPPIGAKIPHDLKTVDQNNQHQDFKALAHKRGLVVLFTRSVDW